MTSADCIYFGGPILSLNEGQPAPEALAIARGRILAVGRTSEVFQFRSRRTEMRDLAGGTLMPGFVDGHSHLTNYLNLWGMVDLSGPPWGEVRTIPNLIEKMKAQLVAQPPLPGGALIGFNYDESALQEGRAPSARELDEVAAGLRVVIWHANLRKAVANHRVLKDLGMLEGPIEGRALAPLLQWSPKRSDESDLRTLSRIQRFYARHGITTAQDGMTLASAIPVLKEAAARSQLLIDVVYYPIAEHFHHEGTGRYRNGLKLGGLKLAADGSLGGKSAFLSQPYLRPPVGCAAGYCSCATITQDELDQWMAFSYSQGVQVLVHCNGDAASDMMIQSVRKAQSLHGKKDVRPVMVHAQTVREDQLDAMAELGIFPSFFSAHTRFSGDWHVRETLGESRAFRISPMASAVRRGMIFANHTDAPVVSPDQLKLIHSAVNRTTLSGTILGPEQRISALDALKAVTIGSAHMYFEENDKGSLARGKRADLVVLSRNPLDVPSGEIAEIQVELTIKDGRIVYERKSGSLEESEAA